MAPTRVSEDIDAWCNKCGFLLAHVIMSMKGSRPHRVKCKSCKDVHAYRLSKPGTRKPAAQKTKRLTNFEKQAQGRDLSDPIPYSMSGNFNADDVIDHPKFGIGVVTRVIGVDKIEVVYKDATRQMIFGR